MLKAKAFPVRSFRTSEGLGPPGGPPGEQLGQIIYLRSGLGVFQGLPLRASKVRRVFDGSFHDFEGFYNCKGIRLGIEGHVMV